MPPLALAPALNWHPIATTLRRPVATNAALLFIHFDCAAPGAAAMLASYYLSGCEAVATGRSKSCQ